MSSGKLTNILLLLILLALMANLLTPLFQAKEAVAIQGSDSIAPAIVAAQVSESISPDRLAAEVAGALNNIASANREIAAAVTDHSRSNENIGYALEKIAGRLREQESTD